MSVSVDSVLLGDIGATLLPAEFISADGFGITVVARRYLAPLIAGEAYPPFEDGLPDYVRLQYRRRRVIA